MEPSFNSLCCSFNLCMEAAIYNFSTLWKIFNSETVKPPVGFLTQ